MNLVKSTYKIDTLPDTALQVFAYLTKRAFWSWNLTVPSCQ